jgi:peptidyl-prolyl cis-trans isomerase C
MKKSYVAIVVGSALASLLSLSAQAQNIAIVNGVAVPKSRAEALAAQVAKSGRQITPEIEGKIKEEVVAREIFMQEAMKQGLNTTSDYKEQLELAKQTILIRDLFTDFEKKNPVTDEEIKGEYDKFVQAQGGVGAKEYHVRHILVEKEADAKDIIAKLKKGGKFEDIAKKQSKDTGSAPKGGDLGWANPAGFVKEFSDALVALKKGQTSEAPVKTQFGFHVIHIDDVREAQLPKLEDVKPQIAQQLMQRKIGQYQEDLRAKAKVE